LVDGILEEVDEGGVVDEATSFLSVEVDVIDRSLGGVEDYVSDVVLDGGGVSVSDVLRNGASVNARKVDAEGVRRLVLGNFEGGEVGDGRTSLRFLVFLLAISSRGLVSVSVPVGTLGVKVDASGLATNDVVVDDAVEPLGDVDECDVVEALATLTSLANDIDAANVAVTLKSIGDVLLDSVAAIEEEGVDEGEDDCGKAISARRSSRSSSSSSSGLGGDLRDRQDSGLDGQRGLRDGSVGRHVCFERLFGVCLLPEFPKAFQFFSENGENK